MLRIFPSLYRKIGKSLKLELTFQFKASKKFTIKKISKMFRRKRHYYNLSSIKNLIANLEKDYFFEVLMKTNNQEYKLSSGEYKPDMQKYSETEFYINN